MKDPAN